MELERAIGMLQTNMIASVAVKQYQCHVRMIGRLDNRLQQTWITSDRPCPGHFRVLTGYPDVSFVNAILSGDSHG